jgi:hypothetical protein
MKAQEPVTWKLDEQGEPDVNRSFGALDVNRARERHTQLMMQHCLERGFSPTTESFQGTGYLTPRPAEEVTSPSTCVDARGAQALAVRVWGDQIACTYVTPL